MQQKTNSLNKKKIVEYGVPINSGTTDSVLASLLRQIFLELNINLIKFDILISKYVERFTANTSPRILSSERGNVKKELLQEAISWNVFIKGLVLLNISRVKVNLEFTHKKGSITRHEKIFELNYEDLKDDLSSDNKNE